MPTNHHDNKTPVTEVLKGLAGLFGVHLGEQPGYEIKERIGEVEIREYRPHMLAVIKTEGDRESASEEAFRQLTAYFHGANTENKQLPLTAPVFQEREPRVSDDDDFSALSSPSPYAQRRPKAWLTSFVLPLRYTRSTAPWPIDDHIVIAENSPGLVAVLSYSGSDSWDHAESKIAEIEHSILHNGKYDMMSEPRVAMYDNSSAVSFLRRHEIQISVAPKYSRH